MMSASLPMMSAPLTATTLVIRQNTPIGVNLMIIIMICMMTSSHAVDEITDLLALLARSQHARAEEDGDDDDRQHVGS